MSNMIFFDVLLVFLAILLLIPSLVIFIQTISAYLPSNQKTNNLEDDNVIAVLIPAHNESSGIIATLNSIHPQLRPQDRIVVVADNCNDDTAEVSANFGVEVVQRHDIKNRGKGYALDFGINHLSKKPPDVVIIIDADCLLEENALSQLAASALESSRPVQALYLMYSKGTDFKSKVSEFAWMVKNLVRPLGYANLGFPCQLMGTGMAFKWSTISVADLANGNIVEDMKLGIDLAIAGSPPLFYKESKVISYFPLTSEVSTGQKTRWEHGHLSMILAEMPELFLNGVIKRDINLIAMALDLAVPPLALLVVFVLGYLGFISILFFIFEIGLLGFAFTLLAFIVLIMSIAIAWLGWGKNIISLSSMLYIPIYIIQKVPYYFKFIFKRQKTWNKTDRD
jgi:cellulose synthase/poly-beta-1,6-N-acetylglucosamine synthase-like glycosyltransferase